MKPFHNLAIGEQNAAYSDGLDAARVGSAATSVLRFDAGRNVDLGTALTIADDAADGTSITINEAGVYLVTLGGAVPTSGQIRVGIGNFGLVQPYTGDPTIGPNFPGTIMAAQEIIAPAATQIPFQLVALYTVTQQLLDGGPRGIYLLASDGSGAAPAAGDIVAAETWCYVQLIQRYAAA